MLIPLLIDKPIQVSPVHMLESNESTNKHKFKIIYRIHINIELSNLFIIPNTKAFYTTIKIRRELFTLYLVIKS